ncbi:hypothetical protein [Lachnotalea glycerini]|uniref:Uncharacterized protein n=1 Tax=Lachnotalea glycerini TaxID=1763509 RepID=A0A371JH10_9FIRM|nr:hypothetical protein [Lachnotalea glycerini]RDY32018.1 hypothetical protein CG710_006885 [Lachnotalea glycerini]
MKRIISSAGAWGYGPCATLVIIIKKLSIVYEIDFVGNGVALEYAYMHKNLFKKIYKDIEEVKNEYDLAISIIEPTILLWADYYNIDSICVDNLYWLWDWNEDFLDKIDGGIFNIESINDITLIRELTGKITKYGDYSFMYSLPKKVFLQGFTSDIPDNLNRYRNNTELVEPILDISFKKKVKKDKILVSCSGMKNPYVSGEDIIIYIKLIKELFKDVINDNFIFAIPEEYIEISKEILEYENIYCFTHGEMLEKINEAVILFAPAGMATMFESIAYNTMFYTLPEQHDGNYSNYKTFCDTCSYLSGCDIKKNFPQLMLGSRINEAQHYAIDEFYKYYSRILRGENKSLINILKEDINKFFKQEKFYEKIDQYTLEQEKSAIKLNGQYQGVNQIITFVETL